MKKIAVLFALFFCSSCLISPSNAQVPTNLPLDRSGFQIDSYPTPDQLGNQRLLLLFPSLPEISISIDPKILFQFDNHISYSCDPAILFTPKFWNCDLKIQFNSEKRILTFWSFDPSELLNQNGANSLITPFLSPLTNPLLKQKELQSSEHLNFHEH